MFIFWATAAPTRYPPGGVHSLPAGRPLRTSWRSTAHFVGWRPQRPGREGELRPSRAGRFVRWLSPRGICIGDASHNTSQTAVARRNVARRQRNSKRPNHFRFLSPKTQQATRDTGRQQATLFEKTGVREDWTGSQDVADRQDQRAATASHAALRVTLFCRSARSARSCQKNPNPQSPKSLRIVSPESPNATEFAAIRQYHPPDRIPNPAPNP
jgi:hypothetical protein